MMRYRQGWKALNRLLHENRSFSGHERNCAFLNTRGENDELRFADVSAASGLDFADDGRALALTDWDFDGDLDIWVTNRTAPRIRLLKNNSSRENNFLAIKLQGDGQQTNRDAVGARVEVVLTGDNPLPLIKTLSAGDGFLSQSSSWLHFGLGDASKIRHVIVRWPGGTHQQYDNLEINQRYILDQKNGQATPWQAPTDRKQLVASAQVPLQSNSVARTVLPARRLLPTLRTAENEEPLNSTISRPTLISIWSATCSSCVEELAEYTRHAERLRQAGLDVIAVNLDNLEDDSEAAQRILKTIGFPFTTTSGSIELVRSLDVLKRAIFDRWQPLTVPASFLVDEKGFVGVLYQGPVQINQLLSDLQLLEIPANRLREFSSPFPGRWIMPPPSADPLQVTTRFIDEAMVTNGIDYLERHTKIAEEAQAASSDQAPGDLYYVLAILLRDQRQIKESLQAFRKAIAFRPDDFRFRSDFSTLLARIGQLDQAAEQALECLRINSQDISAQRKLAFIRMGQGNSSAAIERFRKVIEAQPNDVACWYNLANAYRSNGQFEQAVRSYRRTLKIQPQMTLAANNLAWVLATHPQKELRNGSEAVTWAERVCEQTNHTRPTFLDTLACAYAEIGEFEQAAATVAAAIRLQMANAPAGKAANMEARLNLFQQHQPFRDRLP